MTGTHGLTAELRTDDAVWAAIDAEGRRQEAQLELMLDKLAKIDPTLGQIIYHNPFATV